MVKTYLAVSLKDPQDYYMEDETIHCQISFQPEKALKDPKVHIKFMGRSTVLFNSTKLHSKDLFTIEKEILIEKSSQSIKKMNTVDFTLNVPSHFIMPSYKNLEGSEGGKIEYMIKADLETSGFMKKSIVATSIISVPLIGNVDINKNELERARESTMVWPKSEEEKSQCKLHGWIPHEGILRGKEVPLKIEYKQPDKYEPIETIVISLIQQETYSSAKDSPPNMTKQLPDRIIKEESIPADLIRDHYTLISSTHKKVMFHIPSNITPSIMDGGKVVRLDYKIRITVHIKEGTSKKELSVNLPVVIGTVGTVSDSGVDMVPQQEPSLMGYPGFTTPYPPPSPQPMFPALQHDIYPPPRPNSGFMPFVLNTQAMPYVDHSQTDVSIMPMPAFSAPSFNPLSSSPSQGSTFMYPEGPQGSPFMYPKEPQGPPSMYPEGPQGSPSMYPKEPQGPPSMYPKEPQGPPSMYPKEPQGPPSMYSEGPQGSPSMYPKEPQVSPSMYSEETQHHAMMDEVESALSRMSTIASVRNSNLPSDIEQHKIDKPNTPIH